MPIDWVKGDAMNAADVAAAAQGASLIVHGANPPGYRNWRGLAVPMLKATIAAAKAERRADRLSGHCLQLRPGRRAADRRGRAPGAGHAQGRDPGGNGSDAARGVDGGRQGADREGRRLLRAGRPQQRPRLADPAAGRRRARGLCARPRGGGPRLGLSAGPGAGGRAAGGPRGGAGRLRGLPFRRPLAGARRRHGPARSGASRAGRRCRCGPSPTR